MIFRNRHTLLSIFAIFMLVFLVALNTPMHSDDYSYYSRGLGLDAHIANYMHWSGRIVADYVSTGMLSIEDHTLKALVNSIGVTSLIVLIAAIPSQLCKVEIKPLVLIVVFALYWSCNPNLGQNSFWVVGSANYAWTTLFVLCFIYYFLKWIENQNTTKIVSLFILGLIAGCSNENTAVTIAPLTVVVAISLFYFKKIRWQYALLPTIGVIIGSVTIILSPGNAARAKNIAFVDWYAMPLGERLIEHFTHRFWFAFTSAWLVIGLLVICSIASYVFYRRKLLSFSNASLFASISFFGCFLLANAALAGAPYTPPRSFSIGFCFLLLCFSCLFTWINQQDGKIKSTLSYAILLVSLINFIGSYYFVYSAYKRTTIQQTLRESSIRDGRSNGLKSISIPDYFFTHLKNYNDRYDRFHNEGSYGRYYGISKAPLQKATFDYSGIAYKPVYSKDVPLYERDNIKSIFMSPQQPFISGTLILEISNNIDGILSRDGGVRIFLHILKSDGSIVNKDFFPTTIELNGRFYAGVDLSGVDINDINSLLIGTFNIHTRHRYTQTQIKIN